MSSNHSHWQKQADAIQQQAQEPLGAYQDEAQDREPTPEEAARDQRLREIGALPINEPQHRAVFCVRPGLPLYDGDVIKTGAYTLTVNDGVPHDAKLIQVFADPLQYPLCVHAVFEHPSFPSVYEGAQLPRRSVSFSMAVTYPEHTEGAAAVLDEMARQVRET